MIKKPVFPVDSELKSLIDNAAQRTHLSRSAVMRGALRIGVPEFVKRSEAKASKSRLFNLDPWDANLLTKAYRNKNVDGDYAGAAMTAAQSLPKE